MNPLIRTGNYIDGQWSSDGPTYPVVNPASGALIVEVQRAAAEETDLAIDAANRALPAWRACSASTARAKADNGYDADLDAAVKGAMASKFRNTGQTCVCVNRFFIQDGVYDAFTRKLAEAVSAMRVGSALDETFLRVSAAWRISNLPVRVEPVNDSLRTTLEACSAPPMATASPETMLNTPANKAR